MNNPPRRKSKNRGTPYRGPDWPGDVRERDTLQGLVGKRVEGQAVTGQLVQGVVDFVSRFVLSVDGTVYFKSALVWVRAAGGES